MVNLAFPPKMYNTQPILPGAGLCLFSTLSLLWNEFFLVNILDTVIGILQLAKPKGTVGVSTVIRRKTSAFSNNPPPNDCFATNLLTINYDELSNRTSWEIRLAINYNHDVSGSARFNFGFPVPCSINFLI